MSGANKRMQKKIVTEFIFGWGFVSSEDLKTQRITETEVAIDFYCLSFDNNLCQNLTWLTYTTKTLIMPN